MPDENELDAIGGGRVGGTGIKNLSIVNLDFRMAKSFETEFFIPGVKEAFLHLWKAFTNANICRCFDVEFHTHIKTDILGYVNDGIFSLITSDQRSLNYVTHQDLGSSKSEMSQWYLVAFFFKKMICAEIPYKTHNQELLAIVETFKTWCHYLEGCKYKVFVFNDHNNLH